MVYTEWWTDSFSAVEQWAEQPRVPRGSTVGSLASACSPDLVLLLRYPDSWYRDITSNKKFFSLAATYRGAIVGMIVAEIKSRTKIHKEVSMCDEELVVPVADWAFGGL